ncbi:nuclear transport factor 2 family protein [candidate division KSB1 bacterium]
MKTGKMLIIVLIALFVSINCFAQTEENEKKAIEELINKYYVGAAYNNIDTLALKTGFHESFNFQWRHEHGYFVLPLRKWTKMLEHQKLFRPEWNNRTTAKISVLDVVGNASVARVDIYNNKLLELTDLLSLYKFKDGWKITNRIFSRNQLPEDFQALQHAEWEKHVTEKLHPPEKVFPAIGVKKGMVIGEIGAGNGRYTFHLASGVGKNGKVYANDIDENALSTIRDRCKQNNVQNVETILGGEIDPKFPEKSLDMAFMIWAFHGLDKPGPLFKNLKKSLKPNAPLVIIDPIDSEVDLEVKIFTDRFDPSRPNLRERIEKAAEESGFELIEIKTFLPKDDIYILKIKSTR